MGVVSFPLLADKILKEYGHSILQVEVLGKIFLDLVADYILFL